MADLNREAGIGEGETKKGQTTQVRRRLADGLPRQQQRALVLLIEGRPIHEAAASLGIHRGTLYRWIKGDPEFRAAYNQWQMEQRESCRAGLVKCAEQAVARVARMVEKDEHLAFKVLKEMGLFRSESGLKTETNGARQEIEIEQLETEAGLQPGHLKRLLEEIRARPRIEALVGGRATGEGQEASIAPPEPEPVLEQTESSEVGDAADGAESAESSVEDAPNDAAEPAARLTPATEPTAPPAAAAPPNNPGATPNPRVARQGVRFVDWDVEARIG